MSKSKSGRVRRQVTVSVVAPVSATIIVERPDDECCHDDWEIVDLIRIDASASLSTVRENLDGDGFDDLVAKANAAEDLK